MPKSVIQDKIKKEFEKKLGKLTLLEDDMESYYTVVNPSAMWRFIEQALSSQHKRLIGEIREKVKGLEKRRLDSPRSLGGGEIVNVAPGYNQALNEVLSLLDSSAKEEEEK